MQANQDVIRVLEGYGAEVVNASLAEWVNYISYDGLRAAKAGFRLALRQFRLGPMKKYLKDIISFGGIFIIRSSGKRRYTNGSAP